MITIGITGTSGAGKGTAVEYLVEKYKMKHFSVGGYLSEALIKHRMEVTRDNLIYMGNKIRNEKGSDYIVKTLYKNALKSGRNSVIESVRSIKEAKFIKSRKNSYLIAITATAAKRYERISLRNENKDKITYKKFLMQDKLEMKNTDPTKQNLSACIRMSDFLIQNNKDKKTLYKKLESVMKNILTLK